MERNGRSKEREKERRGSVNLGKSVVDSKGDNSVSNNDPLHLESELKSIPSEFHTVDFNPLPSVVRILQSLVHKEEGSSSKLEELEEYFDTMEASMNMIVEGFNKSIKNYSQILGSVNDSQANVQTIKRDIELTKKYLYSRSQILKRMWRQNLEYKEMINIFDKIEDMKKVPAQLDTYVQGKHYLHAAHLLVGSVNSLFGEDLRDIKALYNLRSELIERKTTFHEMLIEELHDLIYERKKPISLDTEYAFSDYTSSKSKAEDEKRAGSKNSSMIGFNSVAHTRSASLSSNATPLSASAYDESKEIVEDVTKDPLLNKKHFMAVIVEALHVMDRLPTALSALNAQSGLMLKVLVSQVANLIIESKKTVDSVSSPPPAKRSASVGAFDAVKSSNSIASASSSFVSSRTLNTLEKLLSILFPRFIHILGHHMYLSDLITRRYFIHQADDDDEDSISSKSDYTIRKYSSNPYTMEKIWGVMQHEIELLLKIHLQVLISGSTPGFTRGSTITNPDLIDIKDYKEKRIFSFADSSAATFKEVKTQTSVLTTHSTSSIETVIKPSPYNMASIYPLVSKFDEQVTALLTDKFPSISNVGMRNFIDEYVEMTFHPFIRSDYSRRVQVAIDGLEAFKPREAQKGSSSSSTQKVILQSAVDVLELMQELFIDIVMMPKYRDKFASIIEYILQEFLKRCTSKYNEIIQDTEIEERLESPEYLEVLRSDPLWVLLNTNRNSSVYGARATIDEVPAGDDIDSETFRVSEFSLECALYLNSNTIPPKSKLIFDPQNWILLATIHNSLSWLSEKISGLSSTIPVLSTSNANLLSDFLNRPGHGGTHDSTSGKGKSINALSTGIKIASSNIGRISKAVTNSAAAFFKPTVNLSKAVPGLDSLIKEIKTLSEWCLFALRTELRLHCYYFLDGIRKSSYMLDEELTEPDSYIVDLNKDISTVEETLAPFFSKNKMRYVFDGLAHLMCSIMIKSIHRMPRGINRNGVLRICRNVFALQQNLTNIVRFKDDHFDRVRRYYRLVLLSEEDILSSVSNQLMEHGSVFTLDEYKAILTAQQSRDLRKINERTVNMLEDLLQRRR